LVEDFDAFHPGIRVAHETAMLQDLRVGVRTLVRALGFSLTAAVTLALGSGVTSPMFSVVNAVLLPRWCSR